MVRSAAQRRVSNHEAQACPRGRSPACILRDALLRSELRRAPQSLIPNKCLTDHDLARRRDSSFTLAMKTQASALAIEASKSLASLRLRPNQAKVRSTTQRRGSALKVPTL